MHLLFIALAIVGVVFYKRNPRVSAILLIVAAVGLSLTVGLCYLVALATALWLAAGILLLLKSRKALRAGS